MEDLNFGETNTADFNFNTKSSYNVGDKKVNIEFDLQSIFDYLHSKKVIIFKGDLKEDMKSYGLDLSDKDTEYYYVNTSVENKEYTYLGKKESVLTIFKQFILQDINEQLHIR